MFPFDLLGCIFYSNLWKSNFFLHINMVNSPKKQESCSSRRLTVHSQKNQRLGSFCSLVWPSPEPWSGSSLRRSTSVHNKAVCLSARWCHCLHNWEFTAEKFGTRVIIRLTDTILPANSPPLSLWISGFLDMDKVRRVQLNILEKLKQDVENLSDAMDSDTINKAVEAVLSRSHDFMGLSWEEWVSI